MASATSSGVPPRPAGRPARYPPVHVTHVFVDRGEDVAGIDGVDPDAAGSVLRRPRLRQHAEGCFGGLESTCSRGRHGGAEAPDVDDRPVSSVGANPPPPALLTSTSNASLPRTSRASAIRPRTAAGSLKSASRSTARPPTRSASASRRPGRCRGHRPRPSTRLGQSQRGLSPDPARRTGNQGPCVTRHRTVRPLTASCMYCLCFWSNVTHLWEADHREQSQSLVGWRAGLGFVGYSSILVSVRWSAGAAASPRGRRGRRPSAA
jgi:hypothetical protein